ncbi:ABC transporter permease [Paralimibaculum aggregatum]|uniref:ABC transporter permease n=1 Tax=Paralimibaculum aggregatum TaxID=3036245 RepID=A0ABQ6LHJ7_9RHOB|nr:ABC transporter permease [Limibaculum sp. NKW23]GMG82467.1 ABC transporter permease [Limibaculum sp. NKW23]
MTRLLPFMLYRLGQGVLVMLVVAFISFSLFTHVGDPINNMLGEEVDETYREQLREDLGLNDPVPVRFIRFVGNAVQGEFGVSYRNSIPVAQLFGERLPATLELVFAAAVIALALGIPAGVYAAIHRSRPSAQVIQILSLIGISLPTFVTGILLIYVFSISLDLLPSFGRGEVVDLGWWSTGFLTASGLKALVLPAVTLALFQLTLIMRLVRSEMLEVLRTDYIRFARARGLPDRLIHFRHAVRNTLVPVITITGLQIGSLVAFAIITETVFQWPGMGLLFIQAVQFVDIPVMSAYLVLIAFFFVVINFIVDILYHAVDPRLSGTLSDGSGKGMP